MFKPHFNLIYNEVQIDTLALQILFIINLFALPIPINRQMCITCFTQSRKVEEVEN